MDALLTGLPASVALGDLDDAPFRVHAGGLILVAPQLVDDPPCLAIAARWGLEALRAAEGRASGVLNHGEALLALAHPRVREKFQHFFPTSPSIAWLQSRLVGIRAEDVDFVPSELDLPVESLMLAGGDSRLAIDPHTGLNRYGVCPRPRPEAVHFSSSTASAISDHGFLFCDLLRRQRPDWDSILQTVVREIRALLGLNETEADVIITPSGTEAELVAVLFALARGDGPLVNILIAPEESGRGVKLAGEGRLFDGEEKGQLAFPGREIHVAEVPIRDDACRVRDVEAICADVASRLASPGHILLHLLHVSKTGLSAPSIDFISSLRGDCDVVVDACQMRTDAHELGDFVKRGWMVQISGSKFYTGPPFSGALVVPRDYRERAAKVKEVLETQRSSVHTAYWGRWWSRRLPSPCEPASSGPLFRWLPALLEAELYQLTDQKTQSWAFEQFRSAITTHFARSRYLRPIEDEVASSSFAQLSITSFQVLVDGHPLNEAESTWLFQHLNHDLAHILEGMSDEERTIARLPCHIGQPVVLRGRLSFLRFVLGARFFNIVGHADYKEAALASEIADAKRVLTKIEWMAKRWTQLKTLTL